MAPVKSQEAKDTKITQLPSYAIEYAPLLYMSQEEEFWPSRVDEFMRACTIEQDNGCEIEFQGDVKGKIAQLADPRCTANSYISFKRHPVLGIDAKAMTIFDRKPDIKTGHSEAPIWIIVVDKNFESISHDEITRLNVTADFYAFNLGNSVVGKNFGNHVGDWEHTMTRFVNGVPKEMHYSQHAIGTAYTWDCLEKVGNRPVVYCAAGSHANYPLPGRHNYANIPFGAGPHDRCSKGITWDGALNYICTTYDPSLASGSQFQVIAQSTYKSGPTDPTQVPLPTTTPQLESPENPLQTSPEDTQGSLTKDEILQVLNYEGRWGNYWSATKQPNCEQTQVPKFAQRLRKGLGSIQVWKGLVWSMGPTWVLISSFTKFKRVRSSFIRNRGPRDKALNRKGMSALEIVVQSTAFWD